MHADNPSDSYPYMLLNNTTGKLNFLRQLQLELSFCTIFSVADPSGKMHFLRGFYWNVNWQAELEITPKTIIPHVVSGGNSCNVGNIFEGAPTDPRFLAILQRPQPTNCNMMAQSAMLNPNVKEVVGWPMFDVRH